MRSTHPARRTVSPTLEAFSSAQVWLRKACMSGPFRASDFEFAPIHPSRRAKSRRAGRKRPANKGYRCPVATNCQDSVTFPPRLASRAGETDVGGVKRDEQ